MKTYIINSGSHFRHLWPLIPISIILPIGMYYVMLYKKGYFDTDVAFLAGGITLIVYVLPMIVLHISYYFRDRYSIFEFGQSGKMIYRKGDARISFSEEDIQKITVYKSRPLTENRTPILAWDYYNYAVIELKDSRVIKLSSLLVSELDKVVNFDNIEIKKTLYAWMS